MKTGETRLAALTCLDKTPEQVQAEKREALERELENLRHDNRHGRLYRLAAWRRSNVIKSTNNDKDPAQILIVCSLSYSVVQCMLLVLLLSLHIRWFWTGVPLLVFFIAGACFSGHPEFEEFHLSGFLRRHLLLPIMPFIRLFDGVVCWLPERYFDDSARAKKIKAQEEKLAAFLPSKIVPEFYNSGIAVAREELLGEASELRKAERELAKRLEHLRSNKERLRVRMERAKSDQERVGVLTVAMADVTQRETRLTEALANTQTTMAKTRAILDECEASVTRLCEPLEDAELLREIQADEVLEAKALQLAQEALERHVSLVRVRIMQLASAVSAPAQSLPSKNPEQDLDNLFAHLEDVAVKVAAMECAKLA